MVDNVIVTVNMAGHKLDMELPAQLPIKELSVKLLESLKSAEPNLYRSTENISLSVSSKKLDDNSTLDDLCVWDGSIIDVVKNN